jgi:Spy/CpxP family protein refolding chaperone
MKWIDWNRGILAVPVVVGGMVAFGCGASSSSSPPEAPPSPSVSAAPVATASPPPAPSAVPAVAERAITPPEDTSSQEDGEVASELVEHHRHHHHGGVARFIAMSLDTLGTTPEQRAAIEKIQADLRAKLEPARAAEGKVVVLLADGIASGHIDKGKVDTAIARVGAASAGVHAAAADSMNQLHSVLDPAQRAELVEKVEAHWQVWKEANGAGAEAAMPSERGHLEGLARELSLTADQIDKIRTALKAASADGNQHLDEDKVTSHIGAFGTAFEAASFDAKTLKSGDTVNAHLASWGAMAMAHFYEAVAPVLTPEQRAKLAENVREHANHKETPATG